MNSLQKIKNEFWKNYTCRCTTACVIFAQFVFNEYLDLSLGISSINQIMLHFLFLASESRWLGCCWLGAVGSFMG